MVPAGGGVRSADELAALSWLAEVSDGWLDEPPVRPVHRSRRAHVKRRLSRRLRLARIEALRWWRWATDDAWSPHYQSGWRPAGPPVTRRVLVKRG